MTNALLEVEAFENKVWEPACGDGSMATPIADAGYSVLATDIRPRGTGEELDFLAVSHIPDGVRSMVTNPPYAAAEEFVHKALELRIPKFALLTRYAFLEGQRRHATIWSKNPPARVWLVSRRLVVLGNASQFAHSWLVWDGEADGTRLSWLTGGSSGQRTQEASS